MKITLNSDTYLYSLRLLGNLWTSTEHFPVLYPFRWIPESLYSHLRMS